MSSGYNNCNIKLNVAPFLNPEKMTIEHKTFPDMFRSSASGFYRSKRRWGMWNLIYDWVNLEQDQAMPLIAQFNRYISADVPFTVYDVSRVETSGVATAAQLTGVYALAYTNGQRGQQIELRGLPPGIICFKAGDLIGGADNKEMYEVAADFQSTGTAGGAAGSGTGFVQLTNFIRKPLARNQNENIYTDYVPVKVMGKMQAPDISGGMPLYSFSVEMSETW